MKIHVLSDLHLEFADFTAPATEADVVVLAGDIHTKGRAIPWAIEAFPGKPVIYVLGNHEYYGEAIPKHTDKLRTLAAGTNVHVLENESIEIDGVRFLGCTLWTDFELYGDPRIAGYFCTQKMTDYRKIRVSPAFSRLRSIDTAVLHRRSRDWLFSSLSESTTHSVVVTHHAPSAVSLGQVSGEDLTDAAYASNLDRSVGESSAVLWIHGHVHRSVDYVVGSTRVVCNPRGYPDEDQIGFNPEWCVEI